MLKRKKSHQSEMQFVTLEELVPEDHLLREIDAAIVIYDKVESKRPRYHPVAVSRAAFHCAGVKSFAVWLVMCGSRHKTSRRYSSGLRSGLRQVSSSV